MNRYSKLRFHFVQPVFKITNQSKYYNFLYIKKFSIRQYIESNLFSHNTHSFLLHPVHYTFVTSAYLYCIQLSLLCAQLCYTSLPSGIMLFNMKYANLKEINEGTSPPRPATPLWSMRLKKISLPAEI